MRGMCCDVQECWCLESKLFDGMDEKLMWKDFLTLERRFIGERGFLENEGWLRRNLNFALWMKFMLKKWKWLNRLGLLGRDSWRSDWLLDWWSVLLEGCDDIFMFGKELLFKCWFVGTRRIDEDWQFIWEMQCDMVCEEDFVVVWFWVLIQIRV